MKQEELKQYWINRIHRAEESRKVAAGMLEVLAKITALEQKVDSKQAPAPASQPSIDMNVLNKLIERVDILGRDLAEVQAKLSARERVKDVRTRIREETMRSHVDKMIDILKENRKQFTAHELQRELGLDYPTTIRTMREAADAVEEIKLNQGRYRKLFIAYVPTSDAVREELRGMA